VIFRNYFCDFFTFLWFFTFIVIFLIFLVIFLFIFLFFSKEGEVYEIFSSTLLKTAGWSLKIGDKKFLGQDFFHSIGNDTKIDLYVDKIFPKDQ